MYLSGSGNNTFYYFQPITTLLKTDSQQAKSRNKNVRVTCISSANKNPSASVRLFPVEKIRATIKVSLQIKKEISVLKGLGIYEVTLKRLPHVQANKTISIEVTTVTKVLAEIGNSER